MTSHSWSTPLYTSVFYLDERHSEAEAVISKYVQRDIYKNVLAGILGGLGGAATTLFAMSASIYAHGRIIYEPLIAELAVVYLSQPEDVRSGEVKNALKNPRLLQMKMENMVQEVSIGGIQIGSTLAVGMIEEILPEILVELGTSAIPVIGSATGAIAGYELAKRLTRRFGLMVAVYYQNGCKWAGGNRAETAELVRRLGSEVKPQKTIEIKEVLETHISTAMQAITYFEDSDAASSEILQSKLEQKGCPSNVAKEAVYRHCLNREMQKVFSLPELDDLCFHLGIDHEVIPGREKSARVRELILHCARRNMLNALVQLCRVKRPFANW